VFATPLVSHFKRVTFTPYRLLTDGSRIRKDFRDFSITSLQTLEFHAAYLGIASDLRDRKQEERLNAIKLSEFRPSPVLHQFYFVPLQSSHAALYLHAIVPWFSSLHFRYLMFMDEQADRALSASFDLFPSSGCAWGSPGDKDGLYKTTETIRYDSTADCFCLRN